MIDWSSWRAVERVSRAFRGTCVPIAALFENLESAIRLQPSKGLIMLKIVATSLAALLLCAPAIAADVTYRKDILPLWKEKCAACHGAQSPYLGDYVENEKKYKEQMKGPRMDTFADLIFYAGWPDTGALMRRLDDGSNTANRKPGNMYQYLGGTDEQRQANLKLFKAWVGEEGWILKRWDKRGDVPAITKEEMSRMKLKY